MKKNKHTPVIIVALILVAVAIGAGVFFLTHSQTKDLNQNVTTPSKTTDSTQKASDSTNNTQQSDNGTTSSDQNSSDPTYSEGKTPEQYSGQESTDTPAYDNEQFRIPDGE